MEHLAILLAGGLSVGYCLRDRPVILVGVLTCVALFWYHSLSIKATTPVATSVSARATGDYRPNPRHSAQTEDGDEPPPQKTEAAPQTTAAGSALVRPAVYEETYHTQHQPRAPSKPLHRIMPRLNAEDLFSRKSGGGAL